MEDQPININNIVSELLKIDNIDSEWDEDTDQIKEIGPEINGQRNGLWYFINGNSFEAYHYVDGVINGEYKYYINNKLISKGNIKGSPWYKIGLWDYYHPSGIFESGIYIENKKQNSWIQKYKDINYTITYQDNRPWNGFLLEKSKDLYGLSIDGYRVSPFQNGQRQGERKEYYENGNLQQITNFLNDKEHGEQISYFLNGTIENKSFFQYGNREGEMFTYYPNGNIKLHGYWLKGERIGEWNEYDETGNIISNQRY
jgi:antitoxin component YwqK of YwqJK toxin-antitoxin module